MDEKQRFAWKISDSPAATRYSTHVSQQNLERYRQAVDAFNRRDRAAFLALVEPELENFPPRDWPESEPIRGREAIWDFLVRGNEPWQESRFEIGEVIEAGSDRIVAELRAEMRGKASDATVTWKYWHVVTSHEGKARRFEWFAERSEAIKAAGISE